MSALGQAYAEQARKAEKLDTLVARLRQFQPEPEGSWDDDPYARLQQIGRVEGWNAAVADIDATLRGLGL